MYYDKEQVTEVAVSVDFDTAATTVIMTPGQSIDLKRLILIFTEVSAGSSVVTLGVRNVDDTTSVTLGTFTVGASIALNAVRYVNIDEPATTGTTASDGSLVFEGGGGHYTVNPGQEIFVTSDGVGTAGIANVYVDYIPNGFNQEATYAGSALTFTTA